MKLVGVVEDEGIDVKFQRLRVREYHIVRWAFTR